jgi:hypothetical protein
LRYQEEQLLCTFLKSMHQTVVIIYLY